ncbi:ATP-binding protein, partial [Mesorhizobium sp. M2A.F.Ca.ET.046.02.1.1]
MSFDRGAEWHRWDPHIHAPGTLREDRYGGDWDGYIAAIENATPAIQALGITDYGVTTTYQRVMAEKAAGRLKGVDLIFPNVELRLDVATVRGNFVNLHLLVSPEDPNHIGELNRFLQRIEFRRAGKDTYACTPEDLIRLGRAVDQNIKDDSIALSHGIGQFKANLNQLMDVYRDMDWVQRNVIVAVAGGADGSSGIREAADATVREGIQRAAHVIFSANPIDREFWLGRGKESSESIIEFYGALKPCLWGCDAHEIARVGKPDLNRLCWLKGKPSFDTLHQALIDPERAYVGQVPPSGASPSMVIDTVTISNAPWAQTSVVRLNPGLVAIIGARGSGKTALADVIATGCDCYTAYDDNSFLGRAQELLSGAKVTVAWQDAHETTTRDLADPFKRDADSYERARYLSQQFVEDLCSIRGMPRLISEIERVIFEAHPAIDRDGAADFRELLDLRAGVYRQARRQEEINLASVSDQIGIELEKSRQVAGLDEQISGKEKLIAGLVRDRDALIPKVASKTGERLHELTAAAETVRGYIRHFSSRLAAIAALGVEVADIRKNQAPDGLRDLKERNRPAGFKEDEWQLFLLTFSGDVDKSIRDQTATAETNLAAWKGKKPQSPVHDGSFIGADAKLEKLPLAVLEAEIERLGGILLQDEAVAKRLQALNKRIGEEKTTLAQSKERLADCREAGGRAAKLVKDREGGYEQVFKAILNEEKVLRDLYAPITKRLQSEGGSLGKITFVVERKADAAGWAAKGEKDLFDVRGGPFRGRGTLEQEATRQLKPVWETGDAKDIAQAMAKFRAQFETELLDRGPSRADPAAYRPWSRRFAQWLYSTQHIGIEYAIRYDGIDIQKLSPGTRGIVLVLLYLALDDGDSRPLIIDQPEENLDPQSVYQE